jgi:hypothetical protein
MTLPVRLWICAAHHPVFRCGGWASVWTAGGQAAGVAGGARGLTAPRTALTGLATALEGLAAGGGALAIHTTSPELASLARFLAALPDPAGAPEEDFDLWARILTAAKGRSLSLVQVPLQPDTPAAFAAAWADLAMDKAKATGAFTAAIPKPNLAKAFAA